MPGERVFEIIGLSKPRIYYIIDARENHRNQQSGQSKLTASDEVILFLLFLKHNCVDVLLGAIFSMYRQRAQYIRTHMELWFYQFTNTLNEISVGTLEARLKHAAELMETTITFLMDCSEQRVLQPGNPFHDTALFSYKSNQHSVIKLVVISPRHKQILYMSKSYPGGTPERTIVLESRPEWYDLLDSKEWGIGDNGFDGLDDYGMNIFTPPRRGDPLHPVVASLRVYIENIFADIKDFRACRDEIRMQYEHLSELLDHHNHLWSIVIHLIQWGRH